MQKIFEEPKVEVVEIHVEDVITTSEDDWNGGDF